MVVIVLGQELSAPVIHPHLRDRVETGIAAYRTTDSRYLLFSGGRRNRDLPQAESDVMRAYARRCGIDRESMRGERRSRDTIGNGYFSRLALDDLVADLGVIRLVTADSHVERAAYVFEQCFGDGVTIDTTHTVSTPDDGDESGRADSFDRTREFFDPVIPGDTDAIRRRLITNHDWYDLESAVLTV